MPTPLDRIIPLYRKRVLQRAKENERLLRESGAYTPAEFERFKSDLVDAYRNIGKNTSAPVINMKPANFRKFLKSREFKNLGGTGVTVGENEPDARFLYSSEVYGYPELKVAEKYGTVPMDELNWSVESNKHAGKYYPGKEYGDVRVHLKPNMKQFSTLTAWDSINQWPDRTRLVPYYNLYPVPYMPEDPEAYVGAFMDPVTPEQLALYGRDRSMPAIYSNKRHDNDMTLNLLQGNKENEYIESHVHGPIYPEDIDFVEAPESVRTAPSLQEFIDRYNIRFEDPTTYLSQRPLDTRRELEPRPERFEGWMRRLRR